MTGFKAYILSVVGIAICCSIIKKLALSKGASTAIISAACGIVVSIVVISPLVSVKILQLDAYTASVKTEAEEYVLEGKQRSRSQLSTIILERTQTYIHDKAVALGCDADILLRLSDDALPVPVHVVIDGQFTPYAKTQLSQMIESELGIPKEMQEWNYQN